MSEAQPVWRRRILWLAVAASPLLLVVAHGLEARRRQGLDPAGVAARRGRQPERCLACHGREARAMAPWHGPEALGCSSCHLGNPLSLEKARAHAGLERFPGDLSTAALTCGQPRCHPDAVRHVQRSLMATAAGILSVTRYTFGEVGRPDAPGTALGDLALEIVPSPPASPAESLGRKLCASCHLGTRHRSKQDRARGGGCSACHLRPGPTDDAHPRLSLGVTGEACTGCHSRSGRVALSYHGWHEGVAEPGLEPRPADATQPRERLLPDGRTVRLARSDVHAAAGMSCVDCHTRTDLMGDGQRHRHKEQQVDIACTDCHGDRGPARLAPLRPEEDVTRRIASWVASRSLAPLPAAGELLPRTRRGTALLALRRGPDGRFALRRRLDGRPLAVRPTPADAAHRLPGHERLTCQACHTAWSHQCVGCHTRLDPAGRQWDSVTGAITRGEWIETPGDTRIGPPTLGVTAEGRIGPFLPGMPLCLDAGAGQQCRRLFAPADPHTTQKASRSCKSCHADPRALGLGSGRLERVAGQWRFTPDPRWLGAAGPRPRPRWPDGVPWDGWTTLAGTPLAGATRVGARPLAPAELHRVLEVGRCVACHDRYDDPIYRRFRGSLERLDQGLAPRCRAR